MKAKSRWVSWRMASALMALPLIGVTVPAFAATGRASSSNIVIPALLPGQTESGEFGNTGVSYTLHRLTAQEVTAEEQSGLISAPTTQATPTTSGCWVYLAPTVSKSVSDLGGSYITSDGVTFRFWNGSGSNNDVITNVQPTSSATFPFNTTSPAVANISGIDAYETAYFDFFSTSYLTYEDFDTTLNVQVFGSGWSWTYTDGLTPNKNDAGSAAVDGPWLCS